MKLHDSSALVPHLPSGLLACLSTGRIFNEDGQEVGVQGPDTYVRVLKRMSATDCLRTWYAHRVVWEAAHGPIPGGMQIDHLDADAGNNALSNLDLVTPQQNRARQTAQYRTRSKQVQARETPGLAKPWTEGSINVDRASRALAAAFGCGPCMAVSWQASWVESLLDEEGAFDPDGLAIHARGRVVQDARRYLPSHAASRAIALRGLRADARSLAEDFDRKPTGTA